MLGTASSSKSGPVGVSSLGILQAVGKGNRMFDAAVPRLSHRHRLPRGTA
jgi:hypothetical protein